MNRDAIVEVARTLYGAEKWMEEVSDVGRQDTYYFDGVTYQKKDWYVELSNTDEDAIASYYEAVEAFKFVMENEQATCAQNYK